MILSVDHVGIVVPDAAAAVASWSHLLELEVEGWERSEAEQVEEVVLRVGTGFVQLLSPTAPTSTLARFLARRGPGMHHFGLRVDHLDLAIAAAEARGAQVVEPRARPGSRGTRIGFLHPRGFSGVLLELVEEGGGRVP